MFNQFMTEHFIPYRYCTSLNYITHMTVTAYVHCIRIILRPFYITGMYYQRHSVLGSLAV